MNIIDKAISSNSTVTAEAFHQLTDLYIELAKSVDEHFGIIRSLESNAVAVAEDSASQLEVDSVTPCGCECGCYSREEPSKSEEVVVDMAKISAIPTTPEYDECISQACAKLCRDNYEFVSCIEGCIKPARVIVPLLTELGKVERPTYKHIHVKLDDFISRLAALDFANNVCGGPAACNLLVTLIDMDKLPEWDIEPTKTNEHTREEMLMIEDDTLDSFDYLMTKENVLAALGADNTLLLVPGISDMFDALDKVKVGGTWYRASDVIRALIAIGRNIPSGKVTDKDSITAVAVMVAVSILAKEAETLECVEDLKEDKELEDAEYLTLQQVEEAAKMSREVLAKRLAAHDDIELFLLPGTTNKGSVYVMRAQDLSKLES